MVKNKYSKALSELGINSFRWIVFHIVLIIFSLLGFLLTSWIYPKADYRFNPLIPLTIMLFALPIHLYVLLGIRRKFIKGEFIENILVSLYGGLHLLFILVSWNNHDYYTNERLPLLLSLIITIIYVFAVGIVILIVYKKHSNDQKRSKQSRKLSIEYDLNKQFANKDPLFMNRQEKANKVLDNKLFVSKHRNYIKDYSTNGQTPKVIKNQTFRMGLRRNTLKIIYLNSHQDFKTFTNNKKFEVFYKVAKRNYILLVEEGFYNTSKTLYTNEINALRVKKLPINGFKSTTLPIMLLIALISVMLSLTIFLANFTGLISLGNTRNLIVIFAALPAIILASIPIVYLIIWVIFMSSGEVFTLKNLHPTDVNYEELEIRKLLGNDIVDDLLLKRYDYVEKFK